MKPFILSLFFVASLAEAQQADPALARMRDALRKLTERVTTAEASTAAAQAAQIAAETASKDLTEELNKAKKENKQLMDERIVEVTKTEKAIKDLQSKAASQDQEIARLNESLNKWKAGYTQAVGVARDTEQKRASAESKAIVLQRKVEDRETKNRELFKLGNEILDRYKKFGLGTALTAREPFTGITRVKLQTLVQDYGDKLEDQTVKPEPAVKSSPNTQAPGNSEKPPKP